MTESEAIKDVKIVFNTKDTGCGLIIKDTGTTIISRNRLAPEKPIFDFNSSDTLSRFHCACGKIIWVHHDIGTMDNNDAPNYCSNCGNKFDWSE